MTRTNKAFAYVFNTTSEDKKVSKVLSGWQSSDKPAIPSLALFNSVVRSRIRQLWCALFLSSYSLVDPPMNLGARVLDLLIATLIKYFPEVNERYSLTPYAARVRSCCLALNIKTADVLARGNKLFQHGTRAKITCDGPDTYGPGISKEIALINHQNIVIGELVNVNRDLTQRLEAMKKKVRLSCNDTSDQSRTVNGDYSALLASAHEEGKQKPKTRRAGPKSASAIWFEWYTKPPRLWESCTSRQNKSASKQIVAIMKLFLPQGFTLDPQDKHYTSAVLKLGDKAQEAMKTFLRLRGIKRKFGSGLHKN